MTHQLPELEREARMGALGTETTERDVRRISLTDFAARRTQIADEIWAAATDIGFFQVVDHGIDLDEVGAAFAAAEAFFALPESVKAGYGKQRDVNAGWESKSQVRLSVGTPDEKESFQITRPLMSGLWPDEAALPGFRTTLLAFEAQCWDLAMDLLSCLASRLGFAPDFFRTAHNPQSPDYQCTLRLLHYFAFPDALLDVPNVWRAGAHTDFDCLTLLFQRAGQGGLQVLPGREAGGGAWTPIEPSEAAITCNIGDMLMRWSDDVLPSNFHRVKAPSRGDHQGPRYSIAFFAQADREVVVQGPSRKYPPVTAADYVRQRILANLPG